MGLQREATGASSGRHITGRPSALFGVQAKPEGHWGRDSLASSGAGEHKASVAGDALALTGLAQDASGEFPVLVAGQQPGRDCPPRRAAGSARATRRLLPRAGQADRSATTMTSPTNTEQGQGSTPPGRGAGCRVSASSAWQGCAHRRS